MTKLELCESCQEEFEIVEEVMIYGDVLYHMKCWDKYCKEFYN